MSCVLVVDGTNVVMRCAFGGAVPAPEAVDSAARLIGRATATVHATHLIVAFDAAAPSWRKAIEPTYKAHRTTETHAFTTAALMAFVRMGWMCVQQDGFEADDLIATIAARSHGRLVICSSDSDLLACVNERVSVLRPQSGGKFETWGAAEVRDKYGIDPEQLADFKALVGEPGDNIVGVRGIGPKRAAILLQTHASLANLLGCFVPDSSNDAARVRNEGRDIVMRARALTGLRTDAPVPPISPSVCRLRRERAA